MRLCPPRLLTSVSLAAVLLAGCTSAPDDSDAKPTHSPTPETVVAEVELPGYGGGESITASVHPITREGGTANLTFELRAQGSDAILASSRFSAAASPPIPSPGTIRLFDSAAGTILTPATGEDGEVVSNLGWYKTTPKGTTVQIAYAAPENDAVSVMIPGTAMIVDVPVIDAAAPDVALYDTRGKIAKDVYAPATPTDLPTNPVGTYTTELDGALDLLNDEKYAEVNLDTDVLFDFGSATIRGGSQAVIDRAAEVIRARATKTVKVTGHTDNVDSDAVNQKLSEDRAQSVVDALKAKLGDEFDYTVEGKSFHEPIADNSTDAGRAKNRRVTIAIDEAADTSTRAPSDGELPDFADGPVATGDEGVSLSDFTVRAPRAYELGDFLVVDLEVTSTKAGGAFTDLMFSGANSHRGVDTAYPQESASGVAVVAGTTKVYPADYMYDDSGDRKRYATVSDLKGSGKLEKGETQTFSIAYAGLEDADEVTVQLDQNLGNQPFRLTNIPIG